MAEPPSRVVLDTNVLISALIAQNRGADSPPLRCFRLVLRREVQLVTSPQMLRELLRALRYPRLRVAGEVADGFTALVASLAEPDGLVSVGGQLAVLRRDPADNVVLETALAGRAGHLVTGNARHFSELWTPKAEPVFRGVRVVTPRQFLDARGA